jgi:hypothetical protein
VALDRLRCLADTPAHHQFHPGGSTAATPPQDKTVDRAKTAGAKAGYVYLHYIVDGFCRLAHIR